MPVYPPITRSDVSEALERAHAEQGPTGTALEETCTTTREIDVLRTDLDQANSDLLIARRQNELHAKRIRELQRYVEVLRQQRNDALDRFVHQAAGD